jgi:hypothetical protein
LVFPPSLLEYEVKTDEGVNTGTSLGKFSGNLAFDPKLTLVSGPPSDLIASSTALSAPLVARSDSELLSDPLALLAAALAAKKIPPQQSTSRQTTNKIPSINTTGLLPPDFFGVVAAGVSTTGVALTSALVVLDVSDINYKYKN